LIDASCKALHGIILPRFNGYLALQKRKAALSKRLIRQPEILLQLVGDKRWFGCQMDRDGLVKGWWR
jgi:hypothetical protein